MTEDYPEVSVIVINARDRKWLGKCLGSLVKTDYPNFEMIVVDCQTPGIEEWIAANFEDVRLVHLEEDIGPSASHNIGVAKAVRSSRYLAFLDNDTVVEPNWLKELIKVMQNDEKIGIAQAKILKMGKEDRLDHTGLAIDTLGTWCTTLNMKEENFNEISEVFAASLAACIVKREVFDEVGGFDEDYFIYDDDTDFCWRARLLGYRVVFVPTARANHSGQIAQGVKPRKLFHGVKNRGYTLLKNYELGNLWWRICIYYVVMLLCGITFALLLDLGKAHASLRGLTDMLVNLRKIWRKRMGVQSSRRVKDRDLFERRLLRKDLWATLLYLRNVAPVAVVKETRPS
ncbi:MAG: glycosyltransferase family 2 protein [Candidatus Bathyarchaeota archaeon]|nr:MAG: glycosyltransferase family 2 protein [Candidatus Bathyarchaeota archaeon]